MPRRVHRGFTMIEMVTAFALIAILAGLSLNALGGIKKRGTFVSASGDLVEGVRRARAEAFSRGGPCVFIIDTAGGNWWAVTDMDSDFNIATFNPATPVVGADVLVASGSLPPSVAFGPAGSPGGYGVALPQPYAGVPSFAGSTPTPNFPYCSFCSTTAPTGFGAITFYGSGGAKFSGGPAATGQSFSIKAPNAGGTGLQIMTIAVIGRTGAITNFETTK